jgi:hypothetical protein
MVNYVDLWLLHSRVASLLDGARLELRELKACSKLLLWIGCDITCFLSLSLWMLICMRFFKSLILEFLIQPAILFVMFLGSEMSFRPISHLLNLH